MFKNREAKNGYARKWIAKRKADYLSDKRCVVCGSKEFLEIDHIDPATKISHRIWSWSEERRSEELSKCQTLCFDHHKVKTMASYASKRTHGTGTMYNHGCRCSSCRAYKTHRARIYRSVAQRQRRQP